MSYEQIPKLKKQIDDYVTFWKFFLIGLAILLSSLIILALIFPYI